MDPSLEEIYDLMEAAQYDAALEMLRVMAPERLDDDDRVEYIRCLAQCLSQMDRFEDAEKALAEGLRQYPRDARLLCELGVVLSESGREEEAGAHFESVAGTAPDDANIAYHYGYVLEKLRRLEEAVGQYRRAISIDPSYDWAYLRLAECLEDMGEEAAAVAAYDEYLRRCPEDGESWISLGILHSDANRFDKAYACYERAESLDCDRENLYYNWFITGLRGGDVKVATDKLKLLRAESPSGSRVMFAEAYLSQRSGDLEMVRLRAWQGAGRSLTESGDYGEEGFAAAMAIFRDQRWAQDAERLFDRALREGIVHEELLEAFNELKGPRLARGVWCALTVSARPGGDAAGGAGRYSRAYEVEAADVRAAEAVALEMEGRLGGEECRVERVEETQQIESCHAGVVWVDGATRPCEN